MHVDNRQPAEPGVMSDRDAERYLGVCRKTLYTLRKRGDLPFLRCGRRVLYSRASLVAFIANREQSNAAG